MKRNLMKYIYIFLKPNSTILLLYFSTLFYVMPLKYKFLYFFKKNFSLIMGTHQPLG